MKPIDSKLAIIGVKCFKIGRLVGVGGDKAKVCLAYRSGVCYALKYLKKDATHER